MTEETQTPEVEEITSPVEATETPATESTTEKPKRQSKKKKTEQEIEVEVDKPNKELEDLKEQLKEMEIIKAKLEEERNNLSETVKKLEEEVKITPQKLGRAIKEMGIEPLSVSRENPKAMTIEAYNSMTDSARREWQRTHRADYLKMMHQVKLSGM